MKQIKLFVLAFILSLFFGACEKGETKSKDLDNETEIKEPIDEIPPLTEVPDIRIQRLAKGLNVGHWFAQADITISNLENRMNGADWEFFKTSGFTYVRLSVNEEVVYNTANPSVIKTEYITILDHTIQQFIDNGIAVLFDFHPNEWLKEQIVTQSAVANEVKQFWVAMAKHLKKFDADYLYFEVLNEPSAEDAHTWYAIQKTWVKEIRKAAPVHTIVVDGNLRLTTNNWDDIAAFTAQEPVDDKNVVYNFHCYAPMLFTHQAATWGWEALQYVYMLEYPTNETNVNSLLTAATNQEAKWGLENYKNDNWNKEKLSAYVGRIKDWMNTHNVPVTCNEFGVYAWQSPYESRITYIRDMREILEENNIGWAVWEYDHGFSHVDKEDGVVEFKGGMREALGL